MTTVATVEMVVLLRAMSVELSKEGELAHSRIAGMLMADASNTIEMLLERCNALEASLLDTSQETPNAEEPPVPEPEAQ